MNMEMINIVFKKVEDEAEINPSFTLTVSYAVTAKIKWRCCCILSMGVHTLP